MLKLIDNILGPDLLRALRAMGHGDEIVIVDCNFPGDSVGPEIIRMEGIGAARIADAILSLMPLDDFVPDAAVRMEPVGNPNQIEPIFKEFDKVVAKHEPKIKVIGMERFAFYERSKRCYAVVQSGERALYGNLILKKGIIRPDVA